MTLDGAGAGAADPTNELSLALPPVSDGEMLLRPPATSHVEPRDLRGPAEAHSPHTAHDSRATARAPPPPHTHDTWSMCAQTKARNIFRVTIDIVCFFDPRRQTRLYMCMYMSKADCTQHLRLTADFWKHSRMIFAVSVGWRLLRPVELGSSPPSR